MPGTLSVPERRPFSCPPPSIWQLELEPRLLPAHVERAGALRAVELVRRSATADRRPCALTSIGILPAACAASVWSSAPCSCAIAPISASGCSTPISLLAAITDTRTVSVGHRRAQLVEIDEAVGVDAEPRHAPALALEPLARVEHRLVLGRDGDDVIAAVAAARAAHALEREVVGLGGAAGEDDLARRWRRSAPRPAPRAASTASCASQPNACCRLAGLPNPR